jgi:predicted lysophospholipase L1 biosynthesis ABC-type transport system permease subunit
MISMPSMDLRLVSLSNIWALATVYDTGLKPSLVKRKELELAGTRAEKYEYYRQLRPILEPRLSFKVQTGPKTSIKASYNRMSQYLHLISNTTASNPLGCLET